VIDSKRIVTVIWHAWEIRIVWNWPVVALSRGCWRYTPDIDPRRSFSRTRIGPVKVEVTRW
jgi:hypothetical protein